ncbi:MAG: hypothetical protein GXO40_05310 [Epsilonproteobacteria bacterium]|nr:hypothetical protein [Campylobacterota bacterium]
MMKFIALLFPLLLFARDVIFSLSWQNSYCKIHHQVCDYNYFTIHGLWPKKMYCRGGKFYLPRELFKEVRWYMPSVKLMKHEWNKHGKCYTSDATVYFSDMLRLAKIVNDSVLLAFFQRHRGSFITKQALNRAINKIYPHQATKVFLKCQKGYITEVRFKLTNTNIHSFAQLLKYSKRMIGGCQEGFIP